MWPLARRHAGHHRSRARRRRAPRTRCRTTVRRAPPAGAAEPTATAIRAGARTDATLRISARRFAAGRHVDVERPEVIQKVFRRDPEGAVGVPAFGPIHRHRPHALERPRHRDRRSWGLDGSGQPSEAAGKRSGRGEFAPRAKSSVSEGHILTKPGETIGQRPIWRRCRFMIEPGDPLCRSPAEVARKRGGRQRAPGERAAPANVEPGC